MPSANSETITTTAKKVYAEDGATEFTVVVTSGSVSDGLVHVTSLHNGDELTGDYFSIVKGSQQAFRLPHQGIREVWIKGNGGNVTVSYGVTEKSTNA